MYGNETPGVLEGNPPEDLIRQLVEEARKGAAESSGVRQLSGEQRDEIAAIKEQQRLERAKESDEFFSTFTDDPKAYPGFDEEGDKLAFSIMRNAGLSPTMNDIVIMPGNAGMSLKKDGNAAVALMTDDKVETFKAIARTEYGPGRTTGGPPPHYRGLLERFGIGTILIARDQLADTDRFTGTVVHECGHKVLGQEKETGAVFAYELEKVRELLGGKVRDWVMAVRTPAYFRQHGLKIDPGRRELLDLLRTICTEEEFHREFGAAYKEITGKDLEPSGELAEKLRLERAQAEKAELDAPAQVAVGTVIMGTVAALRRAVPAQDLAGQRNAVRPMGAPVGQTVTFAGRRWEVLDRLSEDPITLRLKCVSLSSATPAVQSGSVWTTNIDGGVRFGLTDQGPWVYTDVQAAQKDQRIVESVTERTAEVFSQHDRDVLRRLVSAEVIATAGGK